MKHEVFNSLYKSEMKRIYYYLRKRGCNKEDAEDIVQETFIKFIEYIEVIDKNKLSSWLFRVATNRYYDLCRIQKRKIVLPIDDETFLQQFLLGGKDGEQELLNYEKREMIKIIISEMKVVFQDLLILKYVLDYSYKEIASLLNSNENTIKTYLLRARKEFKRKWEVQYEKK